MKEILIVDKGWVFVGDVEVDGDYFILSNGSCIRIWGATKGLGQLASEGPLPETILDPLPLTKFHKDKVIGSINCEESKWK